MTNDTVFSWVSYKKTPIVGILRALPKSTIHKIAATYLEAGFSTLEVTMNTDSAGEIIGELRSDFPELNIGAGTVCSKKDLEIALKADAQFIVTPIIDEGVIEQSVEKGLPIFPGAYTPSEIYKAWSLGASAVKVFPATQLGVRYIKDILASLDKIKLLPTGGVSLENIEDFFKAGAFGVGMGSSLFPKKVIQDGDFEALYAHLIQVKNLLNTRSIKK